MTSSFSSRSDRTTFAGKTLTTVFDELDNSILLLAGPGSGKTIALCELARDLIQRAGAQEQYPLPVILRLAPWNQAHRQTLRAWIDAQLKIQYGLGQTHIDEIRRRGLILLLDGLDEVCSEHRSSCVRAINEYCAQEGWINIVVTCRSGDYAELESSRQGLTIPRKQVVTLVPLEAARIEKYLNQLDRVGIHVAHLRSLLESECTPLMTDVILQTYEGKPGDPGEEIQVANVWEKYVARKFEDENARRQSAGTPQLYPPDMIKKWLSWVARQLRTHTRDQHRLFVEELQPDWLSRSGMILSTGLTFLVLLAVAYPITQFAFSAAVPVLYGQEGVRSYLDDYHRISVPLGSLWVVLVIWAFARRSSNYGVAIALGLLSGIVFGTMIWVPYRDIPALSSNRRGNCGRYHDSAGSDRAHDPGVQR